VAVLFSKNNSIAISSALPKLISIRMPYCFMTKLKSQFLLSKCSTLPRCNGILTCTFQFYPLALAFFNWNWISLMLLFIKIVNLLQLLHHQPTEQKQALGYLDSTDCLLDKVIEGNKSFLQYSGNAHLQSFQYINDLILLAFLFTVSYKQQNSNSRSIVVSEA